MPRYAYTDESGNGGTVDAVSSDAARSALRERGITVKELLEVNMAQNPPPATNVSQKPPPLPVPSVPPPLSQEQELEERGASTKYLPIIDTLRLYAGWLIAWYVLVYALGSYQSMRPLPFEIPFVGSLFLSPLVLLFAFGAYLFLLLTSLHRYILRGRVGGVLFALAGIAVLLVFRANVL